MIPSEIQIQAKKEYCFPAVVEILLKFYGYNNMDQCAIAKELCRLTHQSITSFIQDGLRVQPGVLNCFFEEKGYSLREKFISYTEIYDEYDFERKIHDQQIQKSFIICGYNYSRLFFKRNGSANHVSIICSLDSKAEKITLFDPGPEESGHKEVKIDDLWCALKAAQAGIWCIQSLKD